MNAPVKIDALPVWRLDDLYVGRNDPRIDQDLAAAKKATDDLVALKGKFVASRRDPARLGAMIDHGIQLYEEGTNRLWSVGAYASLATAVARDDAAWAKFEADIRVRASTIGADSLFFSLELNELDENEIESALRAHPSAQRWRPWLRRVRMSRPHELTPDLERMLIDRAPAVGNWSRLFDETLSRLVIKIDKDKLTLPEALNRLSDSDPARRKAAAKAIAGQLEQATPVLALSLNTLAFEKQVEDRWRKYTYPAQSRHLANEVDGEAVDAMEEAVVEAYPRLSHRYYALKAKVMGLKHLEYWDRNAPLEQAAPASYSWDEAREMVLSSFNELSPKFAEHAQTFFTQPWIDARPRTGKQGGAFSHPVTADRHPYVMLNFMGERRDVLTLAHELGHAVHQTLASPLGTLLADTPLTLAETASIFGEALVFDRLLEQASKTDRRALLAGKIEDALNTVVRQIAFHRFETRFHAARAEGELSADQIGGLWLEVQHESLGPAIRLGPGYEHYWAYVSHFVHAPFYVYAYAFGNLLVESLVEARSKDPKGFTPKYEALLAAGGTKTYVEALAPFGLDPRQKAFWEAGLNRITRLVDEFEALA